jgi:hypothetical protein
MDEDVLRNIEARASAHEFMIRYLLATGLAPLSREKRAVILTALQKGAGDTSALRARSDEHGEWIGDVAVRMQKAVEEILAATVDQLES